MAVVLNKEQIEAQIKSPSKSKEISNAIAQQERLKFHTDTNLDIAYSRPYYRFCEFVRGLLPRDKAELALGMLKFPIPTNSVTEEIFTRLFKLFDGRNPANNYQFHTAEERDDWEWYRQEVLNEHEIWRNRAWDFFKTEINCVMVVDMPMVDGGESPEPYFYFVPIASVVSYSVDKWSGNMEWIIYREKDRLVVIDGESYKVFDYKDKVLGEMLANNPHGLPYCPARFFWNEPLSLDNPDVKRSPLSKSLADLDWYLFKVLSQKHLDLYAGYPIYSGFEEECDYNDKDGNVCSHGHLVSPDGTTLTDLAGNPMPCPLCGRKKNLAGAGSYIEVPIPTDGQPDLRKPIDILSIDKQSLDYNVGEVERLRRNIISACVGLDNTILNETSLADKQVDASFESQDVVLNKIKQGFEEAQTWVDTTCCLLRYGDGFISASVSYGTEFYTLTPEVLQERYKNAKESGASESELDALRAQMIETEYRHNPLMLQRMLILSDIEPFRHSTKSEVVNMFKDGLTTKELVMLKNDFMGYIKRFERENDNIIEFGASLPYNEKIDTIFNTLLGYVNERIGGNA